jgi:hypothetical protein
LWLAKIIIFHDPVSNYIYKGDVLLHKLIKSHKSLICGNRDTGLPIDDLALRICRIDNFLFQNLL